MFHSVWSPPPQLDTKLANISRVYFFPAAFLSLGTISMFFAAMFPLDSVCLPDDSDAPLEYATARDDFEGMLIICFTILLSIFKDGITLL